MVQYPLFNHEFSPTISGGNVFTNPGRGGQSSSTNESTVSIWWPFVASKWKDFGVKIRIANGAGTLTVVRRVNEMDVGVPLTFTSADPIGTVKKDGTEIDITKGDRLTLRNQDSSASGDEPIFQTWSYIEFADGLWGF